MKTITNVSIRLGVFCLLLANLLAGQEIKLTILPLDMYRYSDPIKVGWEGTSERLQLKSATSPGGGVDVNHYNAVHMESWAATGLKTFVYEDDVDPLYHESDLKFGVNYCILVDTRGKKSAEFLITMESGAAPSPQSPANGTVLSDLTPEFKWTGNSPYYSILVSDEPFTIKDEKLQGLNAIWQTTTSEKSIRYGQRTEFSSGTEPPPLMSGKVYNWLVLNNYDPVANIISTIASDPSSFTYNADVPAPPVLISPEHNDTLTSNDPVVFQWERVEGAVSYRIDLFEENIISDNQANVAIWQKEVNNPEAVLSDPSGLLRRLLYKWRVYVYDSKGRANVSVSNEFYNGIPAGTILFRFYDHNGDKVPFVKVLLDRVPGLKHEFVSESSTDEEGFLRHINMPYRTYTYTATKGGFQTYSGEFDFTFGDKSLEINMQPTLGKIFGNVKDKVDGNDIKDVLVTVLSLDNADETAKLQPTSSSGDFSFEVPFGSWRVAVEHPEYENSSAQVATVTDVVKIANLNFELNKFNYKISGNVINSFTLDKLYDAGVTIKQNGTVRDFRTGGDGSYTFTAQSGEAELVCQKSGYSTVSQFLNIQSDISKTISLEPGASNVSGRAVDNLGRYLMEVNISAISQTREVSKATSQDGSYRLSLPAGNWELKALKPGYTTMEVHNLLLEYGQDISVGFTLVKNESFVNGQVFEETPQGVQTLANVQVRVTETGQSDTTDALGRYSLSVDKGAYSITSYLPGYAFPDVRNVYVGDNDTLKGINFTGAGNAANVAGVVFTNQGPMPAAQVYAKEVNTGNVTIVTSDNQGRFQFSVFYGTYKFWAKKDGYLSDTLAAASLNPGISYSGRDVRLIRNTGVIEGAVSSSGSSIIGKNCLVSYSSSKGAKTAPVALSGEFRVEVEAGISYALNAACDDYVPSAPVELLLVLNEVKSLNISLVPSSITYSGTVISAKTSMGLPGVSVNLQDITTGKNQLVSSQGVNGTYVFNLTSGQYKLTFKLPGFLDRERQITLSANGPIPVGKDTLITNEGNVAGQVLSQGGNILQSVQVALTRSGVSVVPVLTDVQGRFRFNALPAGFYSLTAGIRNHYDVKQNVYVSADNLTQLSLSLKPFTGKISGLASLAAGGALAGAQIAIQGGALTRSAFTGTDGTYLFDSLPSGSYSIGIFYKDHQTDTSYSSQQLSEGAQLTGRNFTLTPFAGFLTLNPTGVVNISELRFKLQNDKTGDEYISGNSEPFKFFLPAETYTLSLLNPGYKITSTTFLVFNGNITEPVTVERKTVNLQGSAANQDGAAVGQLNIKLTPVTIGLDEVTTATGSNGIFSFAGLLDGAQYRIGCLSGKFKCKEINVTVRDTSTLILKAEDYSTVVSGTVNLDNAAVSNARVQVSGAGNLPVSTFTRKDGTFEISNLRAQKGEGLIITATVSGVPARDTTISLEAGQSKSGLVFNLKTVRVNFTYKLTSSGAALSGDTVAVFYRDTIADTLSADNAGEISISQLFPGEVITVQTLLDNKRYDNVIKSFTMGNQETQSVTTDVVEHNSVIDIRASTSGYDIFINGVKSTTADQTSKKLEYLPAGTYRVSISLDKHIVSPKDTTLVLNGTGNSTASPFFQLAEITTGLYGTVTEKANTRSLPARKNIPLVLEDTTSKVRDTVYTQDNGSYLFSRTQAGVFTLTSGLPGFAPAAYLINISTSVVKQDVEFTAYEQSVFGRVSSNSLINLNAVNVTLKSNTGESWQTRCGPFGDFGFLNLKGQTAYILKATTTGMSSVDTAFILPLGKSVSVYPVVKVLAEVSGEVASGSTGIPGAAITLTKALTGNIVTAVSDSAGKYTIPGLQPGVYSIIAEKEGFLNLSGGLKITITGINVEGPTKFEFSPKETGVYGSILDDGGSPVSATALFITGTDTLSVTSGADGQYTLKAIAGGAYIITVNNGAYQAFTQALDHSQSAFEKVDLVLKRVSNRFTGRLLSSLDDRVRVSGASLYYTTQTMETGSVLTGQDGSFTVTFTQAPGAYISVDSIAAAGYETLASRQVTLDTLGAGVQDFRIMPVFTFTGNITVFVSQKGDTAGNVKITLIPSYPDDSPSDLSLNPAEFSTLRVPGHYALTVTRDSFPELTAFYSLSPGADTLVDTLNYASSQLKFKLTTDGTSPLPAEVIVNQTTAAADTAEASLYMTPAELTAGDYKIAVSLPDGSRLPILPYTMTLGSNETSIDSIQFPWKPVLIQDTIIGVDVGVTLNIEKSANDSILAADAVVKAFYRYTGSSSWDTVTMAFNKDTLTGKKSFKGVISALSKPGNIQYYYRVAQAAGIHSYSVNKDSLFTRDIIYTNAAQPGSFKVADPNVLKAISFVPTRLEADSTLLARDNKLVAAIALLGENGRNLNSYFDANAASNSSYFVKWSLSDTDSVTEAVGSVLTVKTDNLRSAVFTAGTEASHTIYCTVGMGTVTLQKSINIVVRDAQIVKLRLRFDDNNKFQEQDGSSLDLNNRKSGGYRFSAIGVLEDKTEIIISPKWSLADSSILLKTQADLLSEGVLVTDPAVASEDTLTISVDGSDSLVFSKIIRTYLKVYPSSSDSVTVSNGRGAGLIIPLNGLQSALRIDFTEPEVSKFLTVKPSTEVSGKIINIELDPSQPFKQGGGAVVTLPFLSKTKGNTYHIGHWNSKTLGWDELVTDSILSNDTVLAAMATSFSPFGLLMSSRALGAYGFEVMPNPFTPNDPWALQFEYDPSSSITSSVGVEVEVYNMRGDLVYKTYKNYISKEKMIKAGTITPEYPMSQQERLGNKYGPYMWDGRNTEGKLCRNGRYILKLKVSDTDDIKTYLKKVVLLK